MKCLRTRTCRGATFALFAMVLQIFCTFGHVHFPESSGFPSFKSATAKASFSQVASVAADALSGVGSLPSGTDGDLLCPSCLIGNLVASAVVASSPDFAVPVAHVRLDPPQRVAERFGFDVRTSFWSRGPPLS